MTASPCLTRKTQRLILISLLAAALLLPGAAGAVDRYWTPTSTPYWSLGSYNWTPSGVPRTGDNAFLTTSGATDLSVWYKTNYPDDVINSVRIDGTGVGKITLDHGIAGAAYTLRTTNEYVGWNGKGNHLLYLGSLIVGDSLYVGYNSGSNGAFSLYGSGSLTSPNLYVGYGGAGVFNHSTTIANFSNNLWVGYNSGGVGTYNMSGSAGITAPRLYVGNNGAGNFIQDGASNTINLSDNLYLGYGSGTGNMQLRNNINLMAQNGYVGYNGAGNLLQDGTANTVSFLQNFYAGYNAGSHGNVTQTRGGLSTMGNSYVGYSGNGAYIHSAGIHNVSQGLYLAYNPGSTGAYTMNGAGSISARNLYVGNNGVGTLLQDGTSNTISVTERVYVGYNGGSTGAMQLRNNATLTAQFLHVGYNGAGSFLQDGTSNTVSITNGLILGDYTGSSGVYELKNGALFASEQVIGWDAAGAFTQSGGSNTANMTLSLGRWTTGVGSYHLSGPGTLYAFNMVVGESGAGTFTQDDGTVTVATNLNVGLMNTSTGAYSLNNGTLNAGMTNIGIPGNYNSPATATFTQNGGVHTADGGVNIGDMSGSTASYLLAGGSLNSNMGVLVGPGGALTQSGGSISSPNRVEVWGNYTYNSGGFNSKLVLYNSPTFNGNFVANNGIDNYATTLLPAGRTITVGDYLNNYANLYQAAGGILAGGAQINNYGYMNLAGAVVGNGGLMNFGVLDFVNAKFQNSGLSENYGRININIAGASPGGVQNKIGLTIAEGYTLSNRGVIYLNNNIVGGFGFLHNQDGGVVYGGGTIVASLQNDGAVNTGGSALVIMQPFLNAGSIDVNGSLAGGAITNFGVIESGSGTNYVSSPIVNFGMVGVGGEGKLVVSSFLTNTADGLVTVRSGSKLTLTQGLATNDGAITNSGGYLDNNNRPMTNSSTGKISGYGIFSTGGLTNDGKILLTGGGSTVNGNVTNNSGGNIQVKSSNVTFTGNVTQNGFMKATSSTVTIMGTLTGTYISDPSDNYFTDWVLQPQHYAYGELGDRFFISNDFLNQSQQNALFETRMAALAFTTGADASHTMLLPGADQGKSLAGFVNNFAWGSLDVSNQQLTLGDGNTGNSGTAFYVSKLLGLALSGSQITNIFGDSAYNLYYDARLAENSYLGGLDYNLMGGGHLYAVHHTPTPAAWLLMGSGLLGLLGAGRRFRPKR